MRTARKRWRIEGSICSGRTRKTRRRRSDRFQYVCKERNILQFSGFCQGQSPRVSHSPLRLRCPGPGPRPGRANGIDSRFRSRRIAIRSNVGAKDSRRYRIDVLCGSMENPREDPHQRAGSLDGGRPTPHRLPTPNGPFSSIDADSHMAPRSNLRIFSKRSARRSTMST